MDNIKKIRKGNYSLIHNRYVDDDGFIRDGFRIIVKVKANTSIRTIEYPFFPPVKVRDIKDDLNVLDRTNQYTDKEYSEMLDNEIKRIENYNKQNHEITRY